MGIACDCTLSIIGAGPGGLTAAIYAGSEGIATQIIEGSPTLGGQAGLSSLIENYPGFPNGLSGTELAAKFTEQVRRFGVAIHCPQTVDEIQKRENHFCIITSDESEYVCKAIVMALGVSYIRLKAENVDAFLGRGVSYGAPGGPGRGHGNQFVVGGGNSAGQAAMCLSESPETNVYIVIRGDDLAKSMSDYLIKKISARSNIHLITEAEIAKVDGSDQLQSITLNHKGKTENMEASGIHVYIGAQPRTRFLRDFLQRDKDNFILTGKDVTEAPANLGRALFGHETSVPGIFAIGDVRSGSRKRVVGAVGEGGVVISEVHEYLTLMNGI